MAWMIDKCCITNKSCHLIVEAKEKTLDTKEITDSIENTETICESDKFDVNVCKCKHCRQVYISCFKEYNMANGEDDYWSFWIPVTAEDIQNMKKADILIKFMGELVAGHSSICWGASGKVDWQEGGHPLAYLIFLPI